MLVSDEVDVDLSGRRAIVTGAASGIGRACAERLARAGAHVVVADVDGDGAAAVAAHIRGEALELDLSDIDAIGEAELRADILVNNAGLQHVAAIEEFPPDRFARILRVMLEAPFHLVRSVLPGMYQQRWGRVVNISSAHGLRASPFKAGYVAAKHGLEGLSKVIALEGGGRGVTSNCVCPGFVRTPLVEGQISDQARTRGIPESEVLETVLLQASAIKRLIEPEEVAETVAFLCTHRASFINGASLTIDGGWTAR